MNLQQLFVYGSLMRGLGNHRLIENCELLGPAKLPAGQFTMISLGAFPAILPSTKHGPVIGELYSVSPEILERTDCLEGHPNFYRRELQNARLIGTRRFYKAWVYVLVNHSRAGSSQFVPDNDWRSFFESAITLNR